MLFAALLAGCGSGGEDRSNGSTLAAPITVNTAATMAQEQGASAADYNNNDYGLITGATLKRWKDNWSKERPGYITGKLVILQVTAGETGFEYIKTNAIGAFSYLAASAEWVMTRSNGVISTPSLVLDGPSMDNQLRKYNIDPQNDMIVILMGTASTGNVMSQGRAWMAFRYWGVDAKHLAVLSGGNKYQSDSAAMVAADFQSTAPALPTPNDAVTAAKVNSVKNLPVDNTVLIASVQDMLNIVGTSPSASLKGTGNFLWDARTIFQYSAGQMKERNDAGCPATSSYCVPDATVDYMTSFQNSGSRQGHPWGAQQLQFTNLLDSTKGFSYKSKAQLTSYLNGEVDTAGMGMTDGTYAKAGAGNAYQNGDTVYVYCETTFRAMITGMASMMVLGKPTRFYDGAMIEWNSLSNLQDTTGKYILPADSPWRTDIRSFSRPAASPTLTTQRFIVNAYAINASDIIKEDKLYKTPSGSNTSRDGGGAPPANPCGG
jgi:3-mercaptopyruvate sulfurtransferase SseA